MLKIILIAVTRTKVVFKVDTNSWYFGWGSEKFGLLEDVPFHGKGIVPT